MHFYIETELITHFILTYIFSRSCHVCPYIYIVYTCMSAPTRSETRISHTLTNTTLQIHTESDEFKCTGHEFLTAYAADKPAELG